MRISIIAFLLFVSTIVSGQEYIVIDTNQSNLTVHEHFDTITNGYPFLDLNLYLDVDDDGYDDYRFKSRGYDGSGGSMQKLTLEVCNSLVQGYSFMVDTLVIDSIHDLTNDEYHVDTFDIVQKYSYGDTIRIIGSYWSTETRLIDCLWQSSMIGPEISYCLDDWIGGNHYIGIKTIIQNITYLGWIWVEVTGRTDIIVKESVIIDPSFGIDNYDKTVLKLYPNPFTTSTTISFILSEPSAVTISIFNSQGQLIQNIMQKQLQGEQKVQWNAEGLPPGMYYFRIQAGDMVGGGKMVLMR